ncbi:hypothetical protein TanjilG_18967 [Lupinus angustifolius]|uniref:SHSP domain-containing protein n=1 Tax=Lupinus angustifolius TaxID=3871 RepID=A0A4P1RR63_LUPAN|nr:PREDICTED: putative uncharacterized protein DDB_G0290521 [Lupinus angustifolius]OIW16252.1 hypothetical protein TanjilG_18967 [Lupinus angustifolius]
MQPAERVYEEFEPPYDWAHDQSSDTLILMLPGFTKEHLRVQIASTGTLRLSGERQIRDNIWRQFHKQFSLPSDSDTNGVSAKFESGMLYVKLPKLIKPTQPPTSTTPKTTTTPTTTSQKVPKPPQQSTTTPTSTQQKVPKPPQQPTQTQQKVPKPPQQPTPPQAQPPRANGQKLLEKTSEANIEKTNKPSAPTPNLVQKAAEAKPEKTEPTPMASLQGPKKEANDSQKEKGKSEATTSKAEGVHEAKIEKRSQTLKMLSRQTQEYKNAVSDLVEELKKQKKLANLVVVIFVVLVIGLYIKNAIKSSFGGPKIEEL